jgi:hypothetical protein
VAKAPATAGAAVGAEAATAELTGTPHEGIAVEGLDASAWAISSDQPSDLLKAEPEADHAPSAGAEAAHAFVPHDATGFKEYKILCSRDKIFEGKFDLTRLEEALNYYGRQGWVVKAMSTPHLKGFGEGTKEEIVILLER